MEIMGRCLPSILKILIFPVICLAHKRPLIFLCLEFALGPFAEAGDIFAVLPDDEDSYEGGHGDDEGPPVQEGDDKGHGGGGSD